MNITRKVIRKLFCLVYLIPTLAAAQIRTIIPAVVTDTPLDVTPRNARSVTFNLSSVPPFATVISCRLELTLNAPPTGLLSILVQKMPGAINLCGISLDEKRNTVNQVATASIDISKLANTRTLSILLKNMGSNPTLKASFYSSVSAANYVPRLVICYTTGCALPSTDWASSHANAQHTSATQFLIQGIPADLSYSTLYPGAISNNYVMYNNLLYLTENEKLRSIDPVSGVAATINDNLYPPQTSPVLDRYGRLYYFGTSNTLITDLQNNNRVYTLDNTYLTGGRKISGPVTIDSGGNLYIVAAKTVYAYAPYTFDISSTDTLHRLWLYSSGSSVNSSVALNSQGTIAYFVVGDSVIAVKSDNGVVISSAYFANTPTPSLAPTVSTDGLVFISNSAYRSSKIIVFDSTLHPLDTIKGNNISPIAISWSGVYMVKDATLFKYSYSNSPKLQNMQITAPGNIHSLVADRNDNIYWQSETAIGEYRASVQKSASVSSRLDEPDMIIAPDGSLYACSYGNIVAVRNSFATPYTVSTTDTGIINATFCGSDIIIPDSFSLSNTQNFVGINSISVGKGVVIEPTARVILETRSGTFSFDKGFTVLKGASLACKNRY